MNVNMTLVVMSLGHIVREDCDQKIGTGIDNNIKNGIDMKLEDKMLIKNLANTVKIVNTINGGMAQPITELHKREDSWILKMRLPAVDIDSIKIEVKDNFLFVFQVLSGLDDEIELPYLVDMLNLTSQIDLEAIYAEFNDGEIQIHMPFDEMASGYEKEIEIIKR
ncbi:hypothetical protein [Marinoscillum sp. MHG1-6]|uniref:hypothetical protein n=1 Tax=Marinoscillum sp. MHG1-6 TaxID=2959627 RepID=UPI002157FEBD|nr:hypothetical protein [Marinoscillum sp. MHG1-6]